MQLHTVSLINALTLISMGAWGYFGSMNPSVTALIPVFVGVILMVFNNGIQYENKVISHIAVVLTLVIIIALVPILIKNIGKGNNMAIFRIGLMIATSIFALIMFIRSFIAAKKARKNSQQ